MERNKSLNNYQSGHFNCLFYHTDSLSAKNKALMIMPIFKALSNPC